MKIELISAFILAILFGCTIEPVPIEFGSDACHYCNMTIVDPQHAAEVVTKKGRAYKFDAIECMLNHMKTIDTAEIELFLITDFYEPGKLINAVDATYIISAEIPSPMGAFLSASQNYEKMEALRSTHGGQLFNWKEIILHFQTTDGIMNQPE